MNLSRTNARGLRGFTLIELLVVIAIIGVLAALLIPAGAAMVKKGKRARARAEMNKLVMAIESYKATMGHYPPDNPNDVAVNQLYFELLGVKMDAATLSFQSLVGNGSILSNSVPAFYGPTPNQPVRGFVNAGVASDENTSAAKTYLTELLPAQYMTVAHNGVQAPVLGTAVEGPLTLPDPTGTKSINPFRYNSSSPTNNPNSFDLWVDIKLGKDIFRIANWSTADILNP